MMMIIISLFLYLYLLPRWEVSIPHGECFLALGFLLFPSLCENAAEAVLSTPHLCLTTCCPTHSLQSLTVVTAVTVTPPQICVLLGCNGVSALSPVL